MSDLDLLFSLALVLALVIGVYATMFGSTSRGLWVSKMVSGDQKQAHWGVDVLTGLLTVTAMIAIVGTANLTHAAIIGFNFAIFTWLARKGKKLWTDLILGAVGAVAFYGAIVDFIWGVDPEQIKLRIATLALFFVISALAWTASFFMGHLNARIGLTLFAIAEILSYVDILGYIASPLGYDFDPRWTVILSIVLAAVLGAFAGRGNMLIEGVAAVTIIVFNALALAVGINPNTATFTGTNSYDALMAMFFYLLVCSIILRHGTKR